jgi:hypothetical protein
LFLRFREETNSPLAATLPVARATMPLPCTPVPRLRGFRPLPLEFLAMIGLIMVLYNRTGQIYRKCGNFTHILIFSVI